MKVTERPSLKALNTFGVEASAALQIDIESEEDVLALPGFNPQRDLLLGGGSNVLLVEDVPGNVLLNRIRGRHVDQSSPDSSVVEIGAGENWHDMVAWTIDQGLSGLENLALIPGSAGAAPIQNIGAYGVELATRVESVTAWDFRQQAWRVIPGDECGFGYRDSRFKSQEPHRYLLTSIRLKLDREFRPELGYQGLSEALCAIDTSQMQARDVFDAVVRIRSEKLPDPAVTGNAGSFFKNVVVDSTTANSLLERYPEMPNWPAGNDETKLSAAWMIEKCGLKGYRQGPAGVSARHALVLVNHGGARGSEIWSLAQHVAQVVFSEFGISLEPEPGIIQYRS